MNKNSVIKCFATVLVALLSAVNASAATQSYGFYKITNNNAENVAGQLSLTVWDAIDANAAFTGISLAADQLLFTIENDAVLASSVAEVYIDDGLLGPSVVQNSLGGFTDFSGGGANPGNLPSGNNISPPFIATQELSADVNPGNPSKGVDTAGDILGIVFGLGDFTDFGDLSSAIASGDVRFGLHVRGIGTTGGSDSFVNALAGSEPPSPIPVPAAVWLFGSALVGLGLVKRKKA